jgi:hypothetical protein
METFLRCFANACPTKWLHWVYLAEYWYNTTWHSSLGYSPFYVLYGQHPRQFGITDDSAVSSVPLSDWIQEKSLITTLIQQHLTRAQSRMKQQADKSCSERQFAVGDWVYLKLQPYVQASLAPRSNQKLAFKFFGPFQVLDKIGAVAYKLALPASTFIHLVFHVSQLKEAVPSSHAVCSLPQSLEGHQYPVKVLQRRVSSSNNTVIPQVLIQWSGMPRSLATWEDLEALKQRFPRAPAWGQATSEGGEDVSSQLPEEPEDVARTVAGTARPGEVPRRKSSCVKRPNQLITGPEWA